MKTDIATSRHPVAKQSHREENLSARTKQYVTHC